MVWHWLAGEECFICSFGSGALCRPNSELFVVIHITYSQFQCLLRFEQLLESEQGAKKHVFATFISIGVVPQSLPTHIYSKSTL
jgi:hypothetical protein